MHGATFSGTDPGLLPEEFGHERTQLGSFGDGMGMRSVGAGDVVVAPERTTGTDGSGFLPDRRVDGTGDPARTVKLDWFALQRGECAACSRAAPPPPSRPACSWSTSWCRGEQVKIFKNPCHIPQEARRRNTVHSPVIHGEGKGHRRIGLQPPNSQDRDPRGD